MRSVLSCAESVWWEGFDCDDDSNWGPEPIRLSFVCDGTLSIESSWSESVANPATVPVLGLNSSSGNGFTALGGCDGEAVN